MQAVGLAVEALGKVGDESAIPVLESLKGFPSLEGHNPVAVALGKLGAAKTLANTRSGADDTEIADAAAGVRHITGSQESSGADEDRAGHQTTRWDSNSGRQGTVWMKTDSTIAFILKTAQYPNIVWNVRSMAAVCLGKTQDPAVEEPLLDLAKNSHASIRAHAITGLLSYKPEKYVDRWMATVLDPAEKTDVRAMLPNLGDNYLPREFWKSHRDRLYKCLDATASNGRPEDQVRTRVWVLIYHRLGEQAPLVLDANSSPWVTEIKNILRQKVGGEDYVRSQRYRPQEVQQMTEEVFQRLVTFSSEASQTPK